MKNYIPFNLPYLTGKEAHYMYDAVYDGHLSGNGKYTKQCQRFFQERFGFKKCLLTTSCTDALEMCALLLDIQPGDEVIMPAYTFVSTANAFVLRGATIRFADSRSEEPNLDVTQLEALITPQTKAIVVVHYAGVACDMEAVMALAAQHGLYVVEDAAQAIDSYYKGKPLGSIGHLAAFSFHETKNIISGEGGMLAINDERFMQRAEIIWEKGTSRVAFFRGELDKYEWVDVGSSFLPSEVVAAFLWAQLEHMEAIQTRRKTLWQHYYQRFMPLSGRVQLPHIPSYATQNGHLFYLVCNDLAERTALIDFLKQHEINVVFHYLSLHASPFYSDKHDGRALPQCDRYADSLLRLPLFYTLAPTDQERVIRAIFSFYGVSEAQRS